LAWCRGIVFVSVLLASAGCDHATKQLARAVLTDAGTISLAADTIRFELAANPGGFLNFGAGLPTEVRRVLFLFVVPLAVALVSLLVLRSDSPSAGSLVGLGLVAGGGLANWLDRLVHDGTVTDFVRLGLGPLRTGIFNVADLAVLAGAFVLYLATRAPRAPSRRAET
jgi:signal peptidase II